MGKKGTTRKHETRSMGRSRVLRGCLKTNFMKHGSEILYIFMLPYILNLTGKKRIVVGRLFVC